jgi:hypothetical protein
MTAPLPPVATANRAGVHDLFTGVRQLFHHNGPTLAAIEKKARL